MSAINQKEYLKKYLGIGKAPGTKKKKKKPKGVGNRITIIDDDVDVNLFNETPLEDGIDEDAPQIVAIIDERPLPLRIDDETKRALWEPIGSSSSDPIEPISGQKQAITGFKIGKPEEEKVENDGDRSPPRRKKRQIIDQSPPRKSRRDESRNSSRRNDERSSPPRKSRRNSKDFSPPRKSRNQQDHSPSRKSRRDQEDFSPPRKPRKNQDHSPLRTIKIENSSPIAELEPDYSPPRRKKSSEDNSPPRKSRKHEDSAPPRKSRWNSEHSPPSVSINEGDDRSPPRKSRRPEDSSPPRRIKQEKNDSSSKMQKTLDGKTAGLQNAKELVEETRKFRDREDKLFKSLSKEVSGVNAQTVVRDRKSGRKRDLEQEDEQKRKKQEEEEKQKEKYTRWGRGLVQVENRAKQIEEEIHEMSKPLARYADDEDLERYLKDQERDGDPMLAYIRSKKRKDDVKAGKPMKPEFQGEFMPNRFAIRPGHRWDGVDRSNGYEKKWFEVQNSKQAQMEDSYKWSTEDM